MYFTKIDKFAQVQQIIVSHSVKDAAVMCSCTGLHNPPENALSFLIVFFFFSFLKYFFYLQYSPLLRITWFMNLQPTDLSLSLRLGKTLY